MARGLGLADLLTDDARAGVASYGSGRTSSTRRWPLAELAPGCARRDPLVDLRCQGVWVALGQVVAHQQVDERVLAAARSGPARTGRPHSGGRHGGATAGSRSSAAGSRAAAGSRPPANTGARRRQALAATAPATTPRTASGSGEPRLAPRATATRSATSTPAGQPGIHPPVGARPPGLVLAVRDRPGDPSAAPSPDRMPWATISPIAQPATKSPGESSTAGEDEPARRGHDDQPDGEQHPAPVAAGQDVLQRRTTLRPPPPASGQTEPRRQQRSDARADQDRAQARRPRRWQTITAVSRIHGCLLTVTEHPPGTWPNMNQQAPDAPTASPAGTPYRAVAASVAPPAKPAKNAGRQTMCAR